MKEYGMRRCAVLMLLATPVLFMNGCCGKKATMEEAGKAYQSGDFAKAAAIFAPAAQIFVLSSVK